MIPPLLNSEIYLIKRREMDVMAFLYLCILEKITAMGDFKIASE